MNRIYSAFLTLVFLKLSFAQDKKQKQKASASSWF